MKFLKLFIAICFVQNSWGQYIGFGSLYHENLGMVNSAYLSKTGRQDLFLNYRKQWASVPNSPEYLNALFSLPMKNNKLALGFQVNMHEIGALKRQKLGAAYRYRLKISETQFLSFGLGIGAERSVIDLSRIKADDMTELLEYQQNQQSVIAAFNAGVTYRVKNFDVGLSVDFYSGSQMRFENPTTNKSILFSKVPTYSFQTSWSKKMNERWTYRPSLIAYSTQGLPIFVDLTNRFVFDEKLDFGVGYRQLQDLNVSFGYTFVNQLKMMYLYQFPVSRTTGFGGTHEVALVFRLNGGQGEEQNFGTSSKRAEELRQELDQTQLKIDELNRQLDSLNKRMSNQDAAIDELKKAQVSSEEIKEMVDSIGNTSGNDLTTIKIQKYEVVNASNQTDIDALLEDTEATYRVVLGAFRNVEKARELNKTLVRELGYSLDIVEVKVGEKLMYFVCQKESYVSVKKAATQLVNFKRTSKAKYEPYLNGEPWILKMKS